MVNAVKHTQIAYFAN